MSNRTQIAACIVSALAFTSASTAFAGPLEEVQKEERRIHVAAAKSQEKINGLFEQSQDLLVDYRAVVDQTENLKVYNDYLARLVTDQQRVVNSLQTQIDSIEETKQNIVPLMGRMIDSLEKFINLDVPINKQERLARVDRLRDVMGNSSVTVSEQFRLVLDAYSIENEYGNRIQSYEGNIQVNGEDISVEFFNLGRTALLALTLDQQTSWAWDNDSRQWEELGGEYLDSVINATRMAQNLVPQDLVKLPIKAAE